MAKKEDVAFKEFVEDVLGKLPEEKRKIVQENLFADESVARDLFRGGLREEEFHRRLTDLDRERKAFEQEKLTMQSWYNDQLPKNDNLVKERDTLLNQLKAAKRTLEDAGVDPEEYGITVPTKRDRADVNGNDKGGPSLQQIQEQLNRIGFLVDRGIPRFTADALRIQARAIKENWDIDTPTVLDEALKSGVSLDQAFDRLTAKERVTREEKRLDDMKKKWIEEGRQMAMKDRASSPDRIPAAGPNILDQLTKPIGKEDKYSRIDGAVAAFLENPKGSEDMTLASTGMAV